MPGPALTTEVLSSVTGWMSVACWVVVYTPQIWENYTLKSGEGLSVTFIVLWLLGDITNLLGGLLANLLPTVIILAAYYTLCDIVLLFQVYYYRQKRSSPIPSNPSNPSESTLLLPQTPPTQPKPLLPSYLQYPLLLLFVLASGVVAWYLSPIPDEVSIPENPHHGKGGEVELEWKSQILGYASAVLYLGSRVPQIAHNVKTRCAGLSLAMFFFSISGNITYTLSILLTSLEPHYLLANASWLAGSALTIFLDVFVLAQFGYYSWQDRKAEREKGDRESETGLLDDQD